VHAGALARKFTAVRFNLLAPRAQNCMQTLVARSCCAAGHVVLLLLLLQ
jgi:hypothetical protein